MDITKLYQDFILEHSKNDTNYEKRSEAQHIIEAFNPLCGDKFKLFIDINGHIISKATFHGYGCAISKAATSVLIEKIHNKTLEQALDIVNTLFEVLDIDPSEENQKAMKITTESLQLDKDIKAFEVIKQFPERLTCASLAWISAYDFLKNKTI
jgi:nitrogen fixation protein NifU and related proteins